MRDLGETARAVALQGGDPGPGRGRNDRAQQAFRHHAAELAFESFARGRGRPAAQPVYGDDPVFRGQVDHHGRDARDVDLVAVHHAQHQAGRHAGVHGVAARFENLERGVRGEVVAADTA